MTPEDFARFLEHLSPDAEEANRRYMRLHEKLVGFFYLRGIASTGQAADDTLDRAAVKICAGTPVPDVSKYCLGIARNVAREIYRREQRERATFLVFIQNLADNSDEEIERIQHILRPCFEQLAVEDRELLAAYCQIFHGRARAEHRRALAETMNTTVQSLRMRVTRLRSTLTECVKHRSKQSPARL